jgi:DNA polymerase-3 subunit delta
VIGDLRARELLDEALPRERQDLNLEIIRAGQDALERVEASLAQVGMFGAERAVWIRSLGNESAAETEALVDFLHRGLPQGATLVATSARLDQRSRLYKWFVASGTVVNVGVGLDKRGRMPDADVEGFIRDRVAAGGLGAPPANVVTMIRERAGAELGTLAQEVDKLCLACAPKGKISAEDVRTYVRDQSGAWVFDLTNALSERRLGRAAELLDQLLRQGEAPIRLLAVLAGHVADLIEAARVLPGLPMTALRNSGAFAKDYFPKLPPEVRNRFRSGFRAYYVFQGASAYSLYELRTLHRALVDADLLLKSSRVPAEHVLAQIVQQACGPPAQ